MDLSQLYESDPMVAQAMKLELDRQREHIELIASENFISPAVMAAMGSHLSNKYAEGYPGKRYYGGCEYVDIVENIAIDRAKKLFGAEHANVQPHSGAQANMAVYFALLEPGDTVLGMELSHGGHLTHGSLVNLSGKYYNFISYGLDSEKETIDYNALSSLAQKHKPKMIVAGASAYSRVIDFALIKEIADEVGALVMVDMAHIAGLIATNMHPSPVPFADVVTSTTHKTLRGPRGGLILSKKKYANKIDKGIFPGTQGGPLMHIIAAKAVAFLEAMAEDFASYQRQVILNAKALEKSFRKTGIKMVSDGTDNHLILLDLSDTKRTGKQMEDLLGKANITVNKNTIPNEQKGPNITSGIRVGTPAITTRGMLEKDMPQIVEWINEIIINGESSCKEVKAQVVDFMKNYPLYD